VWRVELVEGEGDASDPELRVLHALRGSAMERKRLSEVAAMCEGCFTADGCIVDQPYLPRLGEGMVRCYMVHDRVVGFGHQMVTALLAPTGVDAEPPAEPPPRYYHGPTKPEFQGLKAALESSWLDQLRELLGLERHDLPAIWDADFLLGPKNDAGEDTHVLCEVNISAVFPMPGEAVEPLAEAAIERAREARGRRG